MPANTTLPSKRVTLRYPPTGVERPEEVEEESYQLLELPNEILKAVEKSDGVFPLTIKGTPSDDAVLCTTETTFLLRTITLSNSLLVCRTPTLKRKRSDLDDTNGSGDRGNEEQLEIRGIEHQVLECVPQSPDLERIRRLLKDSAWKGLDSDFGEKGKGNKGEYEGRGGRRWTRAQLESVVQASQGELERGLRERNVVEVDGYMLMLPSIHLQPLLSLVLNLLTIHATTTNLKSDPPTATSPYKPILESLVEDHSVPGQIASRVISLFGEIEGDTWICDVKKVVGEIGKGLVQLIPAKGQSVDMFLMKWKEAVGETWEELTDLSLMEGQYLLNDPPLSTITKPSKIIVYFPLHNLPLHAPTRFADLFLTRQKWRPEEMIPFLRGLTRDGDKKELDKLVAKFVRVVKEREGVWWFPRRTG